MSVLLARSYAVQPQAIAKQDVMLPITYKDYVTATTTLCSSHAVHVITTLYDGRWDMADLLHSSENVIVTLQPTTIHKVMTTDRGQLV